MTRSGKSGNDNALAASGSMSTLQLQTGNDTPSFSIYDHIPSVNIDHAYTTQACKEDINVSYPWSIDSGAHEGGKQIADNSQQLEHSPHITFPADSNKDTSSTNSFVETPNLAMEAPVESYHGHIYLDVRDQMSTMTHTPSEGSSGATTTQANLAIVEDNIVHLCYSNNPLFLIRLYKAQVQDDPLNLRGDDHSSADAYDHVTNLFSDDEELSSIDTYQHAHRLVHGATPDRVGTHDTDTTEHHSTANNATTMSTSSTVDDAPYVTTDITSQTLPGATATIIQDEHSTLAHNDTPALHTMHGPDDAYHSHNARDIAHGHIKAYHTYNACNIVHGHWPLAYRN